ncbi:ankyrin-2-like isoform X2 [Argiope bruennichi]|uniref:ankyrin-2-like isoform X2 n=1 Tax=Argiope bruennichi TaxID=94029 RepID=UPI0024945812|nr:ankyrin-2-like isoform X2 [Argiope bruennichi]
MNSESAEHSNYDVPVIKHGDFYCSLCDIHMNCSTTFESHIKGKRHLKNKRKGYSVEQKYEYSNEEPAIQKLLDKETRPIAGLEHLVENVYSNQPPTYHCFLCSINFPASEWLIDHIIGLKHQMAFLKMHNIEQDFLKESSILPKSLLLPIVQDLISKYEQEHGRGKMSVRKVKEKSGSTFPCIKNGNNEEISFHSKLVKCSPKSSSSHPKISKRSPPSKISKHSPSLKITRHSPPPKISRHSPPPKVSRYSPPSKVSRYSPPPKITRHSRSQKFSRSSPPPRYFRHSPSPDSSIRQSPSPDSSIRHSPSPNSSIRHSPSPDSTIRQSSPPPGPFSHSPSPNSSLRQSPSPNFFRHSPAPMSSRCSSPSYFHPPRSSRYSPSFSRMKEQNFKSEWQKVSVFEERQRKYDEDKWRKIEPTTFCRQASTHQRIPNSKSEQANNYSYSQLFTDERKNCSNLRAILDQKKGLRVISRANAHDPSEQMPQNFIFDETYPPNVPDKAYERTFQNNNTTDILSKNDQFAHSLDKFIERYKNRKTTQQENPSSHLMSSEQYCDVIISPYNQLNISPYKNTPERISFKDYETVEQENDCLKYVHLNHLMSPEQNIGDTVSPYHQLNSSSYKNTSERMSFNSECSQSENGTLPFFNIVRDSSVIPGLTLTEKSHASYTAAINEYTEKARDILGNNMPSKSSYEKKD